MNLDQWENLLNGVKPSNDSTKDGLLEQIKVELEKQDPGTYEKWGEENFNENYLFEVSFGGVQHPKLTLLHLAVFVYNLDIFKCLLDEKNINIINNRGETALHLAAQHLRLDIVEFLASKENVDINKGNNGGYTALHFAALSSHLGIVECLVDKKKADINKTNNRGETALHFAVENGHLDIVKFLLSKENVDIDKADEFGITALHLVNQLDIAKVLIAHEIKLKGSEIQEPDYPTEHREVLEEYRGKCLDEVTKMKEEKIDRGITFYDIFTSRKEDRLANYMRNEQVVKALEEGSYRSKFPIYVNDLEHLFKIGKQRLDALNKATEIIKKMEHKKHKELFDKLTAEPDIVYNIARHFSNKDIEDLRKAVTQTMDEEDISQSLGSDVRIEPAAKKQGRQT